MQAKGPNLPGSVLQAQGKQTRLRLRQNLSRLLHPSLCLPPFANRLFYAFLVFDLFFAALFLEKQIQASPIPTYTEVHKRISVLWSIRYPVKVHKFIPNPKKRGVLTAIYKGRRVYYYHFTAFVKRPLRDKDAKLKYDKIVRRVELWVRYRPWRTHEKWDLSFARKDLLPGKHKYWIR